LRGSCDWGIVPALLRHDPLTPIAGKLTPQVVAIPDAVMASGSITAQRSNGHNQECSLGCWRPHRRISFLDNRPIDSSNKFDMKPRQKKALAPRSRK
jgi:hypothetical protein